MRRREALGLRGLVVAMMVMMVLAACTPSVPRRYIQPGELEDILYDYHLTRAMAEHTATGKEIEYNRRLYFSATLKKYGYTEEDFDSSMVYYFTHADRLAKIYERVAERMEESANEVGASAVSAKAMKQYSTTGDTANIWRDSPTLMLTPNPPYNRLDFEIDVDTAFRKSDRFEFNMQADYVNQSGTKEAIAYVAVEYANDSVVAFTKPMPNSGKVQMRITANSKIDIKRMWGFIYMGRGKDESSNLKLLFLSDIQFVRFRQPKKSAANYSPPPAANAQTRVGAPHEEPAPTANTMMADTLMMKQAAKDRMVADSMLAEKIKADTMRKARQVKPKKPSVAQPRKKAIKSNSQ